MFIKNKVANNAVWIIGGKVVQSILGVVIAMLTARYLGPSNYGLINYASSLVAFVAPIAKLGLDSILVNELINHSDREGETLGTSIIMSFVSGIFCIIGLVCFTLLANPGEQITVIVCALYSIVLLAHAIELIQYWFQAHLLSKYTSIAMLAAYIIKSVYQVFLLISGSSIYWFAVTSALDIFVIDFIIYFLFRKMTGQKLAFSKSAARRMFRQSRYYIVSSMMVSIFANTDRIMIKMMLGDTQTGYYSAGVACAGLTSFIFSAIITSMRPVILEANGENEDKFKSLLVNLYSMIVYLSLIQCIGITIFAPIIVKILYGSSYASSVEPLRWIVWYTTFSYLGATRNIWILAKKKQSQLWKINLIGALGNIILNLIFIPIWGITGAAIASLFTQIITNFVLCFIIKELHPTLYFLKNGFDPRNMVNLIKKVIKIKENSR
ncbi:MAG: flippase [Clostridiales bacterium]|nr:flippase [Clostridiales bacterium]